MHTHTTIRSWRALAFAGLILAGTCYILFQDVIHGAPITTAHVLTAMALLIATAAGHQIGPTFRARRYPLAASMTILATGAILYVGLMSGARNAEFTAGKAGRIESANTERDRVSKLREEAQAMLNKALKDVAEKCQGGVGKNCKGAEKTRDVYEAAVKGHNAELAKLGLPETANAGYKAIAQGIVLLPWFSHYSIDQVAYALIILLPWLAVLLSEFSVPAFLSLALGHVVVPSFSDTAQTSFSTTHAPDVRALLRAPLPENDESDNDPQPPNGRKPRKTTNAQPERKTAKPDNVVYLPGRHPVIAALEAAGRCVSNEELKHLMGCSSSEASKRWREVRDQLDVGQNGRHLSIGLKAWSAKAAIA